MCSHVEDRNNEVNCTQNGGHASKVQAENTKVYGGAGVSLDSTKGRVHSSAGSYPDLHKGGNQKQSKGGGQQPEA